MIRLRERVFITSGNLEFVRLLALAVLLPASSQVSAAVALPAVEERIALDVVTILGGGDWKLGSFSPGAGEQRGVFRTDFDDRDFRTVVVPGEVQVQIGLKGMDLYLQSRELTFANNKEWWYRKDFTFPRDALGGTHRLVFEGVDYFCTVWLNGRKLGEHEGAYVPFEYDVSSLLNYGGNNQLAVKVTCPWLPKDRGFLEYMKGELAVAVPGTVTEFPFPPFVLGPTWDGLPAGGNAAFPMGLFRDVMLVSSGSVFVSDLTAATKTIDPNGSATVVISGRITNRAPTSVTVLMKLRLDPENFSGDTVVIPTRTLEIATGENPFEQEVIVSGPRLWWTWDTGEQNLYRASATIASTREPGEHSRETVFGIRTIAQHADMSYWLNGRRLFLKGAWYPISDYYGSKPTRETYVLDLELFRAANLNHLISFTVVEKTDFYELCDRLGILNFVELPFGQFGAMAVMDRANPRRQTYVEQALSQVRQIILKLRSHPSIVVWAPFAEAQLKGSGWGAAGRDFDQFGYQEFSDFIGRIVRELAPGTIYHPSFCDAGEQHFWMGTAGPWRATPYQEQYQANTGFVSEYGAIALPDIQSLEKMLTPEQMWSEKNPRELRWHRLPIDVAAYSYHTSFDYIGLAGVLDRIHRFVDTDIRSARELVEGSQLYQAFLFQYATEAYRRRKYNAINGTRIWAYAEPTPGIRFGFLDYFRVPKMGYYYLRRAQARFALSFEYEAALESQFSGRELRIPVWLINDHPRRVPYEIRCEITDLAGRKAWTRSFEGEVGADSSKPVGVVDWVTAAEPGVYVLRAQAWEKNGSLSADSRTFIKVTPRMFSRPIRMLLIGQKIYSRPIALMAENLGVEVRVIDEASIHDLAMLRDPLELRRRYDLVWLGSFDSLWKLLDDETAEGLKAAIRDGLGFVHSGGPSSFHGGSIRASLLNLSPIAEVLPVKMMNRDDLFLGQPPLAAYDVLMNPSPVRDLQLAPDAISDWKISGGGAPELPGFNRVTLKEACKPELTVFGWPLLVAGQFGQGRTIAYMGFTPSWQERRSPWDRKMISSYLLDQELVSDPQVRTFFILAMRIVATVIGETPAVPFERILASRIQPLFETLQDLPAATIEVPAITRLSESAQGAAGTLTLRNGSRFARLVRVRAEWNNREGEAPYLTMFDDNYVDLLPGETKTLSIDLRLPDGARGRFAGQLVVEGSNVREVQIPIELQLR